MYYLKKYQKFYSNAELYYALRDDYGYLSPPYKEDPFCPDGNGVTTLAVFDKYSEVEREWNAHPEYEKGEMTFDDRGALVTMYFVFDDYDYQADYDDIYNNHADYDYHALDPDMDLDPVPYVHIVVDRIPWESEPCVVREKYERRPDGAKYLNQMYFWEQGGGDIEPPIRDDD